MLQPSVAIVILNWNGRSFLEKFLPSVLATTYPVRVIVADNASSDDSILFLESSFPEVELIKLKQNYGFAKGYNEALKHVIAEYYVLLNSDVEVTPGWLEPILDVFASDNKIGACQPKILSYTKKDSFEYAGASGGWIDKYGYPFARGRIFDHCERDLGQYDSIQQIFWATGAALVIKSKLFHELKGFDEYFFAHMEEIDLCWRLQLAGYKIYCCPKSVVYHVGGGTLPKGDSRKTFLNYRNNQIMLAKNLTLKEKWWKIPFRLALDQLSAFKALIAGDGGYFKAVIKAHMAFFYWCLFITNNQQPLNRISLKNLKGVYNGNIIWAYFIQKRKLFRQIVQKEDQKED
ncbi:MAG TPA: glycosyltransferase [Flavisolibacter sp.]|nr:glycosyltransferase [Flavisolibacter sp.]